MYVLQNAPNNVYRVNWYAELGYTREGRCLMLCDVTVDKGAT